METLRDTATGVIGRELGHPNTEIMSTRFLHNALAACKDRARNFKEAGDRQQDSNKKIQYYRGAIRLMAKAIELNTINAGKTNPNLSLITENDQLKPNYKIYKGNNKDPLSLTNARAFASRPPQTMMDTLIIVDHSGHTPGYGGVFSHSEGKDNNYWFEVPADIPEPTVVASSSPTVVSRQTTIPVATPVEIAYACDYVYDDITTQDAKMKNYPKTFNAEKCKEAYTASNATLKGKWKHAADMFKRCSRSADALRSMLKATLIIMVSKGKMDKGTYSFNNQISENEAIKKLKEFEDKITSSTCLVE